MCIILSFDNIDVYLGCGQEGGDGGGGASDCAQFNDAPLSQPTPNKAGAPPLLHPFFGKQANFKGQGKIKQGENINVQSGRKRQDITYGAATDGAQAPLFTTILTRQTMVTGKSHNKLHLLTR